MASLAGLLPVLFFVCVVATGAQLSTRVITVRRARLSNQIAVPNRIAETHRSEMLPVSETSLQNIETGSGLDLSEDPPRIVVTTAAKNAPDALQTRGPSSFVSHSIAEPGYIAAAVSSSPMTPTKPVAFARKV